MLFFSAVSVNYERVLHQHFSVRGGFGAGYAIGAFGGTAGLGPQVMVNFFTRGPNSKFEVGAGASVIYQGREDWITTPAFSIRIPSPTDESRVFPEGRSRLELPVRHTLSGQLGAFVLAETTSPLAAKTPTHLTVLSTT